MLRIAFQPKAGDARQNITFASLAFPIAIHVDRAHDAGPATFPFSLMLCMKISQRLISLIAICLLVIGLITYIGSYYVMCFNGTIKTFLRSEASYSIFVFVNSGNIKRSDIIFSALKPMIYIDGMIMRIRQGVTNYDNVIGLYINADLEEEKSNKREEIDKVVKAEINTLIGFLYHGNGNIFIRYCGTKGITIINGIDVIERISPFDRFKGNLSRDNEDDGDNENIYRIEYFKNNNEFRGIKFNIGALNEIRIISIEIILP